MLIRRTLLMAFVIVLAWAGPAQANHGYEHILDDDDDDVVGVVTCTPTITLDDTVVERGQVVGATLTCFDPGTSGDITIFSHEQLIGGFTMPAGGGAARTTVTIPTDISLGEHTVVAYGSLGGAPATAATFVIVVADDDGDASTGFLARTGGMVGPTALVGVGLVLLGAAVKRSSRRGKATNTA